MEFVRQAGESVAAFRGRERRERADAVDAMGLKAGDPIKYGGQMTRFDPKRHVRKDMSYRYIRRLDPEETIKLEAMETEKRQREEKTRSYAEQQRILNARPEVSAARSIRWELEGNLEKVIDKLTPEEWIALAEKLLGRP